MAVKTGVAEIEAAIKQLGNPEDIDRSLRVFRKAARALSSRQPRLIDLYPKQWVAVYRGKVKVTGRTVTAVLQGIDAKRLPRSEVIIRYIDKNQRTMIL